MEDPHREYCRRQHRMLGHYLAIQSWIQGLDCLVIEREQLGRFLGLKRFRGKRIEWLREDLKPWFRYFYDLYGPVALSSVYLSRKRFPKPLDIGPMTDKNRIEALSANAINAKKLKQMPTQSKVISKPALWAVGIEAP